MADTTPAGTYEQERADVRNRIRVVVTGSDGSFGVGATEQTAMMDFRNSGGSRRRAHTILTLPAHIVFRGLDSASGDVQTINLTCTEGYPDQPQDDSEVSIEKRGD